MRRRRPRSNPSAPLPVLAAIVAGVVSVAACSAGPSGTARTAGSGGASIPPTGAPPFVIDQDFADPDVLQVGDQYYAYATNTPAVNIQLASSHDLKTWTVSASDMLPTLPAWAVPGRTWAPDVSEVSPGQYVMYFAAASAEPALQCIGVAMAHSPRGPFTPVGDAPLVCPVDEGGAIDPSAFVDVSGTRYLVWKNDGNCCGLDTWLQITPLTKDGLAIAGTSTRLLMQTRAWEGHVIEAPTLVTRAGSYVLFYSANDFAGSSYAIGYATAATLTGPYTKHGEPLLSTSSSGGHYLGPGGQDIVAAPDGSDWLVFHSWDPAGVYRGMNVLPLTWSGNVPSVTP